MKYVREVMNGKKLILLAMSLMVSVASAMYRESSVSPGPCLVVQGQCFFPENRPWTTIPGERRRIIVPKAVRQLNEQEEGNDEEKAPSSVGCLSFAVAYLRLSPIPFSGRRKGLKRCVTSLDLREGDILRKKPDDVGLLLVQRLHELSLSDGSVNSLSRAVRGYNHLQKKWKYLTPDAQLELLGTAPELVSGIEKCSEFFSGRLAKPLLNSNRNRFLSQARREEVRTILLKRLMAKIAESPFQTAEHLLEEANGLKPSTDVAARLEVLEKEVSRQRKEHTEQSNAVGDRTDLVVFPGHVEKVGDDVGAAREEDKPLPYSPQQAWGRSVVNPPYWSDFPSGH